MDQLYQEVNQMKKLMAQLKKGNAIGEIFERTPAKQEIDVLESVKAQRLEDLKRQRQMLDVSERDMEDPSEVSYQASQLKSIQRSIQDIQLLRESLKSRAIENPLEKDTDVVLMDLETKEKELNKLLMSGMENF